MEHISLPDDPLESNRERSALSKLRSMVVWMKGKGTDSPYDLNDLMSRIRLAVGDNDRLYDLFVKALLIVDDPAVASDKTSEIKAELNEYCASEEFAAVIKKTHRTLGFERDSVQDLRLYRDELISKLHGLELGGKKSGGKNLRIVDISDREAMSDVYRSAQLAIDPKAILKYPFKAMNRMTGEQGGGRRGDWVCVSALPGQNKTGQLLDTFISMCIFNKPMLFDEKKKPLHVYTTIEDKLELVFQKLYVLLMQHEHKLPVKIAGVQVDEMTDYVNKRLTANNWNIRFFEFENGASSDDYLDNLRALQDEGFEIVSAGCDYVNLIGKQGIPTQVAGDDVQLLHRKLRGWTAPNNIFHYTAHQLSTDAKTLARQYPDDYIKKLPGKGYYEGCKKLDTEFDFEYMVAKTVAGGETWQEVQWAKHRKLGATAEQDKYFALKFNKLPMIGFDYDLDQEGDFSYKKVNARTTNGEGGSNWDDFE